MPLNRDHIALVVVGEQIWVIGGRVNGQSFRTWTSAPEVVPGNRLQQAVDGEQERLGDVFR